MAKFTTHTVFANIYALIDHVKKFRLEAGFSFTIKRSDNTRTHPRAEIGCVLGGSLRYRRSVLVIDKNQRESGTRLTECRWKEVGIQRNDVWHLDVW